MKSIPTYVAVIAVVLLKCCLVSSQADYYPPVIDETQQPVDSREIKCLGK